MDEMHDKVLQNAQQADAAIKEQEHRARTAEDKERLAQQTIARQLKELAELSEKYEITDLTAKEATTKLEELLAKVNVLEG